MSTPPVIRSTHTPMVTNGDDSRRRWIIAACAAAAVVVVAALIYFAATRNGEPRLNASTVVLSKFVSSPDFEHLPFEKQRLYYKVLDDRGKEIDQAYKEKALTEPEYRTAIEAAWLGKHINRVEKYSAMTSSSARSSYIEQLLSKKEKKSGKNDKASKEAESDDIKTDETAAELRVESWPSNFREQWNAFHTVYHQEKKLKEEAATRPSGK